MNGFDAQAYKLREQGIALLVAKCRAAFGKYPIGFDADMVYVYTDDTDHYAVAAIHVGHLMIGVDICENSDVTDASVIDNWFEALELAKVIYKWLRMMQPDFYTFG